MSAAVLPNLRQILSETTSTIKTHSRHFLVISIVFLFPISISTFIHLYLSNPTTIYSHYCQSLYSFSTPNPRNPYISNLQYLSPLLLQILNTLFVSFFPICATAWITYSIAHGYYGTPVDIISTLRSIISLFLPLLATLILRHLIFGFIIVSFVVLMLSTYNTLSYFGIHFDYEYANASFLVIIIAILLAGVLIYLQCEWYLSNAIVIVESKWGYSPLIRSSYIVKVVKRVVFPMILSYGVFRGPFLFLLSCWVANGGGNFEGLKRWEIEEIFEVTFLSLVYTFCLMILSLYSVVSNTVFFMRCKALHVEEFGCEYVVSLPNEDTKV